MKFCANTVVIILQKAYKKRKDLVVRKRKKLFSIIGLSVILGSMFSACMTPDTSTNENMDQDTLQTHSLSEGELLLRGAVDDITRSSINLRLANGEVVVLLSEEAAELDLTIGDYVEVTYIDEKAIRIVKQ